VFKQISPQFVADDSLGVSLEMVDPYSFRYSDNDYVTILESEPLKRNGKYAVCLYLSDLDTWEIPENQKITSDELKTIKVHACKALQALDLDVEVQ
jgi:hypothetical protein